MGRWEYSSLRKIYVMYICILEAHIMYLRTLEADIGYHMPCTFKSSALSFICF